MARIEDPGRPTACPAAGGRSALFIVEGGEGRNRDEAQGRLEGGGGGRRNSGSTPSLLPAACRTPARLWTHVFALQRGSPRGIEKAEIPPSRISALKDVLDGLLTS